MKAAPLAGLLLSACTLMPSASDAPLALAAAESAFAAHSVREDMRAAFLAAFADDGVFVRPGHGWTVSNTYLAAQPAPPASFVLDWSPRYVEVAASGELGLSTGPSRITNRTDPAAPPRHGQYVSVWRRPPRGAWKVEVDLGIAHAEPWLWDAPLVARTVAPAAPAPGGGIAEAEAGFQRIAGSRGTRAAYETYGAADLRLYRNDTQPRASLAAALATAQAMQDGLAWTQERVETAASDDFGYARGSFARAAEAAKPLGYFLRVWRREAAGWRIVLDVVNRAGPPPAQAPSPA
jgi:ketosteroid isomerase-like protein